MAESVRELVVTLSLDAGTFAKTCTDINSQIKGVQAEFNNITAGVDSWQSTIAGREAKLNALTETLGLQQTKISTIVTELKKANDALAADPTNINKARNKSDLERKLNDAEAAAKRTKAEIEAINKVKFTEFATKMTTLGTSLKTFGRKFSMYIGGPLAALGIKSFNLAQDYETASARLQIATQATDEQMSGLNDTILGMTTEIPVSYVEIAGLMKTLSEAGVPIENLEKITRQIEALKATSDITDENVTDMVRFMEIMKIPIEDIDKFSSALFSLGINSIATSGEIFAMATRMGSTGALAGFSAQEILALATAYTSLGIEAEAGGTAANKLAKEFQLAAETGNGAHASLEQISGVMGITVEQFKSMQATDPAGLMLDFFDSLKNGGEEGNASVLALLDSLGITEARLSNLAATAANNPDFFAEMMQGSETAWNDTSAAAEATATAYDTSASKTAISLNEIENNAADAGTNVVEAVQPIIDAIANITAEFGKLDEDTQTNWVKVAGALILLGPAASGIGSVATSVGGMIKWINALSPASVASFTTFANSLGGMLKTATPYIATIWAIVALAKSTAEIVANNYGMGDALEESGVSATVAAMDKTTEAGKAANEQLELYNSLLVAIKDPVNTTTDTAGKVELWTPFFTQSVRDEMFGGLPVEQLVNDQMLGSFIAQYKAKLEADMTLATTEASNAGIGAGTTEGLAAATPVAETAATGLATAVDTAFTGELGIQSPSTVFQAHGVDTVTGLSLGIMQGLPLAAAAMTTLGAALTAIASAQGTAAGAAYGSAFSSSASIQISAAMGKIKRELDLINIRINRGYGSV